MREGWTYKKLGEVATIAAGQGAPQGNDNYCEDGTPFVKAGNLEGLINGLQESDIQKVSEEVAQHHRLKKYSAGSVLFAKSGMSCMKGHVYTLKNDCYVVSHLAIITPKQVNSSFLNYFFRIHKPNNLVKDAAYPSISLKDIENMTVFVPPLAEQERIVAELDLLSSVIEKKKAQLKEYDQLAQSIFYSMFGDPITNEKGWEVKCMGDCFIIGSGGTPSKAVREYWEGGEIPWIGSNMCQNCIIEKTDGKFITEEGLNHSSAKMLESGTVLVALVGATIGKVALLKTNTAINQNIAFIKLKKTTSFIPEFVYYHLMDQYDEFMNIGDGKFKMANQAFIKSLSICIPPLSLQKQFAERIEAIERQKALVQASIADTETLFNSRMEYYFN